MLIRDADSADESAIALLHARSQEDAYGRLLGPQARSRLHEDARLRWHRWFRAGTEHPRRLIVAEQENPARIVGFGLAEINGDVAMLRALHVEPTQRGLGIGTALLDRLTDWWEMRGAHEADLHVLTANTRARTFYASRGWTDTGEELTHVLGGEQVAIVRYRHSQASRRAPGP